MRNSELKTFINSCFNYTGNKYKQLPQLFKLFPKKADTFVDLFGGGGVVGLNAMDRVSPNHVIINDKSKALIDIFQFFKENNYHDIYDQIMDIINTYGLTNTSKYGYKYYQVDSSTGLAGINKQNYLKLRDDYNHSSYDKKYSRSLILYVLIIYAFNNQIRFNKKNDFNLPVGKRDFNKNMQKKLNNFVNALHNTYIILENKDFTDVDIPNDAFVYCDPPYSITTATYNERNLWTSENDIQLFEFLNKLDKKGIHFALSNVLTHNGISNEALINWSKQYRVHPITFDYNNSNYHSKAKKHITQEILITNY